MNGDMPLDDERQTELGRIIQVNGISLYVEDHGSGVPVLLLHGWPDSAALWRNQIPFVVAHGFRVIAPELRGFGRSGRPQEVAGYALPNEVADMTGVLDALGIQTAHVVGHDWGAGVAWLMAMLHPDRVIKLVRGVCRTAARAGRSAARTATWEEGLMDMQRPAVSLPPPTTLPTMLSVLCLVQVGEARIRDEHREAAAAGPEPVE
jgi:pimeloyl-ACP methyl ester carboxylesterase